MAPAPDLAPPHPRRASSAVSALLLSPKSNGRARESSSGKSSNQHCPRKPAVEIGYLDIKHDSGAAALFGTRNIEDQLQSGRVSAVKSYQPPRPQSCAKCQTGDADTAVMVAAWWPVFLIVTSSSGVPTCQVLSVSECAMSSSMRAKRSAVQRTSGSAAFNDTGIRR